VVEPAQRHLRATGIVHAEEQDHRSSVVDLAFHPSQGVEALPGEALGQQGKEVGHRGPAGELVIARHQEPLDGLGPEGPVERLGQPDGRAF
jgi:hypothetical protein